MFKQAVLYYPTEVKAMERIAKEIVTFRCTAAVNYIESLSLNDRQIEALYTSLEKDIAVRQQTSA